MKKFSDWQFTKAKKKAYLSIYYETTSENLDLC